MRRRDHERIVHEKDKTISWLREQNRDLLDRLMFSNDKTWMPPPRPPLEEVEEPEPYMVAPEQMFDASRE